MTVGEVSRWVNAYDFQRRNKLRDEIDISYMNAAVIIRGINKVLSGKGTIPTLYELYPDLFEEERLQAEKQQKSIANFLNFANNFNKKFRKGN